MYKINNFKACENIIIIIITSHIIRKVLQAET
jgi:hypothetical protein